jgi:hypothetical protein
MEKDKIGNKVQGCTEWWTTSSEELMSSWWKSTAHYSCTNKTPKLMDGSRPAKCKVAFLDRIWVQFASGTCALRWTEGMTMVPWLCISRGGLVASPNNLYKGMPISYVHELSVGTPYGIWDQESCPHCVPRKIRICFCCRSPCTQGTQNR